MRSMPPCPWSCMEETKLPCFLQSAVERTKMASTEPKLPAFKEHCRLVRAEISVQRIVAELKAPEDGATVVFEGIVRNHSRGRRTLYLDYEAYEPMALKELNKLADKALSDFPVRDVR